MSVFTESLKRLYTAIPSKVSLAKLDALLAEGKITQAEYDYIIVQ